MYPSYDHSEPQAFYGEDRDHAMMQYLQPPALPSSSNADVSFMDHEFHQQVGSTASGKASCFSAATEAEVDDWRRKSPPDWSATDVLHWIANTATNRQFAYEDISASSFNVDGSTLLTFSREDFISRDPKFGEILFETLQRMETQPEYSDNLMEELHSMGPSGSNYQDCRQTSSDSLSFYTDSNDPYSYPPPAPQPAASHDPDDMMDTESSTDEKESDPVPKKVKRPPGRPPGAKAKAKAQNKTGRLWEFIRNLLHNPETCPSLICWEDHDEGIFRFVKSEKVANIWGARKNNDKMNYEKLSRAMRYYYPSKVFQPVLGRKLVYKFGPNAKNWRSENPNFRQTQK